MERPSVAYKRRLKRKRLLWRGFRSRHALDPVVLKSPPPEGVLIFAVMRNEMLRLPAFLAHYRALGAAHFFIIAHDSTDGTEEALATEPDVSLWRCFASYREAAFGRDWLNHLLWRYGHGRWCLTVDADELLVYDGAPARDLMALTRTLAAQGRKALGALMLDLYPKGPLNTVPPALAKTDPIAATGWFDPAGYHSTRQEPLGNLWTQGGVRERVFFADEPRRAPTLNKLPLVHWRRSYAYVNSTHSMLPRRRNFDYDGPGGAAPSGVLLHTKFLPDAPLRAAEDLDRREHFNDPTLYTNYNKKLTASPVLWNTTSEKYECTSRLIELGLMTQILDI